MCVMCACVQLVDSLLASLRAILAFDSALLGMLPTRQLRSAIPALFLLVVVLSVCAADDCPDSVSSDGTVSGGGNFTILLAALPFVMMQGGSVTFTPNLLNVTFLEPPPNSYLPSVRFSSITVNSLYLNPFVSTCLIAHPCATSYCDQVLLSNPSSDLYGNCSLATPSYEWIHDGSFNHPAFHVRLLNVLFFSPSMLSGCSLEVPVPIVFRMYPEVLVHSPALRVEHGGTAILTTAGVTSMEHNAQLNQDAIVYNLTAITGGFFSNLCDNPVAVGVSTFTHQQLRQECIEFTNTGARSPGGVQPSFFVTASNVYGPAYSGPIPATVQFTDPAPAEPASSHLWAHVLIGGLCGVGACVLLLVTRVTLVAHSSATLHACIAAEVDAFRRRRVQLQSGGGEDAFDSDSGSMPTNLSPEDFRDRVLSPLVHQLYASIRFTNCFGRVSASRLRELVEAALQLIKHCELERSFATQSEFRHRRNIAIVVEAAKATVAPRLRGCQLCERIRRTFVAHAQPSQLLRHMSAIVALSQAQLSDLDHLDMVSTSGASATPRRKQSELGEPLLASRSFINEDFIEDGV